MNTSKNSGLGQSIFSLFAVADKLNEFGKQFGNPDCALAGVMAYVSDDTGSIDEDQTAQGPISLHLDIEFFRIDDTPQNGEQAESAVVRFAEELGFNVKLDGDGSGEFGKIHCYILTAKMSFADQLKPHVERLGTNEAARICGVTPRSLQLWRSNPAKPPCAAMQAGALLLLSSSPLPEGGRK